jgi:hyperosmotically inducible protein
MKSKILGLFAAALVAVAGPALADKTTGEHIDDGTITTEVKAGLVGAKDVPSSDVNVEVYKGQVLLTGFVTKPEQKTAAEGVAKAAKGVTKVHNKLIVHPSTSMGSKLDDTVLVGKVKAALVDEKKVDAGSINVEARDSIVQLGGFVAGEGAKRSAMDTAKAVSGVKKVEDGMVVKPN